MTLHDLATSRVTLRRSGRHHVGPCPKCGGDARESTRFVVYPDDTFHCFVCEWNGDRITFLRDLEGHSCKQAHAALGLSCTKTDCPAFAKCQEGKRPEAKDTSKQTPAPPVERPDWTPAPARTPLDLWREKADNLVASAHAALLDCPDKLAYLDRRGLPRQAVERYRLGWIAENLFRDRAAWGLPEELHVEGPRAGQPKKMLIPAGIVIPYLDAAGVHRIRIRREQGEPRYYWLPGSGDDVVLLGPGRRAFVVVESDLDALMIDHLAGDLVGVVPLGTCSAKPKKNASEILSAAKAILVALDYDDAGRKCAPWWTAHFPQAERLCPAVGKDPGEDYAAGVDVRAWIQGALPPGLAIKAEKPAPAPPIEKAEPPSSRPALAVASAPEPIRGVSAGGREYVVVYTLGQFRRAVAENPETAVVGSSELAKIAESGIPEEILMVKEIFPGATIQETRPCHDDPRQRTVRTWVDERREKFQKEIA